MYFVLFVCGVWGSFRISVCACSSKSLTSLFCFGHFLFDVIENKLSYDGQFNLNSDLRRANQTDFWEMY